jgi:hypothetical protein
MIDAEEENISDKIELFWMASPLTENESRPDSTGNLDTTVEAVHNSTICEWVRRRINLESNAA